tara:strand:+ start:1408 stop:2895 length:1488 start_codon:yes stop_codon:yes gene_type:complete
LGRIAQAFLYSRPSRVIITGPSLRQVEKQMMANLRDSWFKSQRKLFAMNGRPSNLELKLTESCFLIGIPARNPDNVRGFHAGPSIPGDADADELSQDDMDFFAQLEEEEDDIDLLWICDEAQGVDPRVFDALEGMMTKPGASCLWTGNPMLGVDDDHPYVKAFREGSGFHRIRVSSFPQEQFPETAVEYDKVFDKVPKYLVSDEDKARALTQHDPDEPIFLSDWLGRFSPGSSTSVVVPRTALMAALGTNYRNLRPLGPRIGIDIGTGNPDPCVASLFVNGVKRAQHKWAPAADDHEGQVSIADVILQLAAKWGSELDEEDNWSGGLPISGARISIDDSGLVGVCDILANRGCYVDRVNFARSAQGQWREIVGTQRFLNIRVEMHWVARRGLQEGIFVIPMEFRESWDQATWTHYERSYDGTGPLIKLEGKDKVKARHGGKSPDAFDADILAMRDTGSGKLFGQTGAKILTDVKGQPMRAGRLRPTKLPGAKRIS